MNATPEKRGFTLIELVTVMGVLVLMGLLWAPVFARTQSNSQASRCLNNLRQLGTAWRLYADDNTGGLVWNRDGQEISTPQSQKWVGGWLDYTSFSDNTNTALLVDHSRYSTTAFLGPYIRSPSAFKCPADPSTVVLGSQRVPRVRSVSMNNYVGEANRSWTGLNTYQLYRKIDAIGKPTPSALWIILDEREESINDGCFFTNPDSQWNLIDYPAAYHNRGGGFAFADGHSEIHRWMDPRTAPVLAPGQSPQFNVTLPGDVDLMWLQQHATSRP